MTLREAVAEGSRSIGAAFPESPFLDASLLLASVLGCGRDRVLALLPDGLPLESLLLYRGLVARRARGEPLAYLTGEKEFYGRSFLVDERALIPRPETELLVESALLALPPVSPSGPRLRAHDGFTGSGCVGISIAAERPDLDMSLSDYSADALKLCERNCLALLGVALPMEIGSVLSAARGPLDLITANPPYVTSDLSDCIRAGGNTEPRDALDGGPDGLAFYAPLAAEAWALLAPGGTLAAEIGDEQGEAVRAIYAKQGFKDLRVLRDLAGHDRVALGVRP
ncbi:MAG TPA: peptide chain release factor N(5)-glutamine methyltransferase [Spirochaetaceae bacterium]|nr:peptide chain release factor N(5)-glutamine methyltransferase [Spirochaetaceae bacterium]